MVARDILLAELTGVRYHVAHLSTKHAVAMVSSRSREGFRSAARYARTTSRSPIPT